MWWGIIVNIFLLIRVLNKIILVFWIVLIVLIVSNLVFFGFVLIIKIWLYLEWLVLEWLKDDK